MDRTGKILIVVTNVDQYDRVGFRTGLWLGELTHFWDAVEEHGFQSEIASPSGGWVPLDPQGLMMPEMGHNSRLGGDVTRHYRDRQFMDRLNHSLPLGEVSVADYDAIDLAGGHGTMWDFRSPELGRLLAEFHDSGKIVSAVCHGPVGFIEARLGDGRWLVQDRDVTAFSWAEEQADNREDIVPFNLEEELKARGARYTKAVLPFGKHVVEDGRLITGQNPASARGVGEAVAQALRKSAPPVHGDAAAI
ncbi:type 1 glutamine amidotransferase domain-containing protein [Sphingobium sp. PNB]|uniref:type 1 glutamine amidotransferase domain-containing protein n=1 Tax=Sphingobium sp. PNB TaxID=863934 RepID=UPI001CA43C8B|nr:type 1 glutamine amidotransferase domain-containing protein [Sphingobium sp. PNB]MCB4857979.1 type 1 glutamine amidotransferase domain-containing protein [Sphingobium sp. PNB]